MKKKSIIGLFAALLGLSVTTTSCEDMLTPEIDRYTTNFSGRDTVNFYFGILSCLQDVAENNLLLGELRGDLVTTTNYVSDSVGNIYNFTKTEDGDNAILDRSAYYKVINQCNYYLAAVDTLAQKNNIYYMRREFAQVQFVRAWTYMQLVQNYGSVPFITSPVSNANTGWENGENGVMVTADNLLDELLKHGLDKAYEYQETYGTPQYGSANNGAMDINTELMVFPGDVVMGDLYLLRGASQSDYEKAASYYYNYLDEQCEKNSRLISGRAYVNESGREPNLYYTYSPTSWYNFLDRGSSLSTTGEVVTLIPSAANTAMGTILTRTAKIYGFNPSSTSSASTTTGTNSSGETTTTYDVTGRITVTADYTTRQVTASNRYRSISDAQPYCMGVNASGDDVTDAEDEEILDVKYYPSGDARIAGAVRTVSTAVGQLDFINKRATSGSYNYTNGVAQAVSTSSFSFNYTIPVYRMRQIYLRYAEAVNRAGYPRYAFAILRDGLNDNTIPALHSDSLQLVSETDTLDTYKQMYYVELQPNGADIDAYEAYKASNVTWLDFTESRWDNNIGVHKLGSGTGFDLDTLYSYSTTVSQRIAEEQARVNSLSSSATKRLARSLKASLKDETSDAESDTTTIDLTKNTEILPPDEPTAPANLAEQINAVETLIADEMALETAFEGSRYYDLYRIARHKNQAMGGDYGTRWFAWQIARRGITPTASGVLQTKGASSYADPQNYDASLYSKLLDMDNWYLQSPQY